MGPASSALIGTIAGTLRDVNNAGINPLRHLDRDTHFTSMIAAAEKVAPSHVKKEK